MNRNKELKLTSVVYRNSLIIITRDFLKAVKGNSEIGLEDVANILNVSESKLISRVIHPMVEDGLTINHVDLSNMIHQVGEDITIEVKLLPTILASIGDRLNKKNQFYNYKLRVTIQTILEGMYGELGFQDYGVFYKLNKRFKFVVRDVEESNQIKITRKGNAELSSMARRILLVPEGDYDRLKVRGFVNEAINLLGYILFDRGIRNVTRKMVKEIEYEWEWELLQMVDYDEVFEAYRKVNRRKERGQ